MRVNLECCGAQSGLIFLTFLIVASNLRRITHQGQASLAKMQVCWYPPQSFPILNEPEIVVDVVHYQRMKTIMSLEQPTTLDGIKQLLEGTQAVAFKEVEILKN
jgi:hypothetical protein